MQIYILLFVKYILSLGMSVCALAVQKFLSLTDIGLQNTKPNYFLLLDIVSCQIKIFPFKENNFL